MGKKIIFLEDKPEKLKQIIGKIAERGENISTEVLYYVPEVLDEGKKRELEDFLQTEIQCVNMFNFDNTLDKLYEDPDNLFVFDTVLSDNIEVFIYRSNVSYALRKKKQLKGGEKQRIWFYTVAGRQYLSEIIKIFENYVLRAEMDGTDLKLDFEGNENFQEALGATKQMV